MKIVACYSNKGGVGKTAASVNLAHAWATSGARTLLCDLDPQGASSFYFRVKPSKKLKEDRFFRDADRFGKAIRGSDYDNLDILPSNLAFRDFDIFLSRMKSRRSRLKQALSGARNYDVVVLDCPPNISMLSENVFKAADQVVVPVIPTTLSERTLAQLVDFFDAEGLKRSLLTAYFSMVQTRKTLHTETMQRLRADYPGLFLDTAIPFSTDVEKMGIYRAPVATFAGARNAGRAFHDLWSELEARR